MNNVTIEERLEMAKEPCPICNSKDTKLVGIERMGNIDMVGINNSLSYLPYHYIRLVVDCELCDFYWDNDITWEITLQNKEREINNVKMGVAMVSELVTSSNPLDDETKKHLSQNWTEYLF